MTLLAQATAVQRIRYHLGDMPWETTGSAANASTTTVAVVDGTQWVAGDIGEFVTNGENILVQSVSVNNLTVVRGYYGSTAATQAASSRLMKNPKYRYSEITNGISMVIKAFLPWPEIYKIMPTTITPALTTTTWYDLVSDALALVNVYQLSDNAPIQRRFYGQRHQYNRVLFESNLPTTLVASTNGIAFPDGFLDSNNTVYITYAAKITDTVASTNYSDLTDGDAVCEAVVLGTVAFLQGALELRKAKHSGAETDRLRAASYYNHLFHSALASAAKELDRDYPLMNLTGVRPM